MQIRCMTSLVAAVTSSVGCSDDVIGCYGDLMLLQLNIMENSYSNFSFEFSL